MKEKCFDCPFSKEGPGAILRKKIRQGWNVLLRELVGGKKFPCHHTMYRDNVEPLPCVGAIEWKAK